MKTIKEALGALILENVVEVKNLKIEVRELPWYKFREKRLVQSKIDSTKRVVENLMGGIIVYKWKEQEVKQSHLLIQVGALK